MAVQRTEANIAGAIRTDVTVALAENMSPGAMLGHMIEPSPPIADFALPWDDPVAPPPVAAITRTVRALRQRFDLCALFESVTPLPLQIGGVARCEIPVMIELGSPF